MSFLGLIWFTPRMTADHALLTAIWSVYIFVGSYLKDLRLEFYLGDTYREYAQPRARLSRNVLWPARQMETTRVHSGDQGCFNRQPRTEGQHHARQAIGFGLKLLQNKENRR